MYAHTLPRDPNMLGGEVAMWSEYVDVQALGNIWSLLWVVEGLEDKVDDDDEVTKFSLNKRYTCNVSVRSCICRDVLVGVIYEVVSARCILLKI